MIMREYDFQSFPQTSRVAAKYQAILSQGRKPVIIDCGGHVGLSAVWFATRYPEALVFVVEPNICNFKMLQRNTAAYPNVVALHGGVWEHPCRLEVSNPGAGSASFRLVEVPDSSNLHRSDLLRGYTIDEIGELGDDLSCLFLAKIDIEGAEAELFRGPSEWLQRPALVLIELHDWLLPWQGTSRNLFKKLAENNFDAVFRGENLFLFRP
jgi:FkbM family methyltransferase